MQVLCQLSYSPGRGDYSDRPRVVAKGLADLQVDPEEDQGPEEDGQEGGEDELDQADADVVIGEGDVDADQDIEEAEEAEPATEHDARSFVPPPEAGRVVCAAGDRLGKPTG
jgi:hypothetical protein